MGRRPRRRIAAVGAGPPPAGSDAALARRWLLPGFVDLHVHGGGGDGLHVDPAVVRLVVAAKGVERVVLITDRVPAAGLPDGDDDMARAAGSRWPRMWQR